MSLQRVGPRLYQFARSAVVLGALLGVAPVGLAWAARRRFGGAMPFRGVPSPADWEWSRIRAALTDRLTEDTIADVVIRGALVVAWIGLAVFLVTVVAEALHMVRHGGMHLPDVRGLGFTQQVARVVAAGLLVVLPMLSTPSRATARSDAALTPLPRAVGASHVVRFHEHAGGRELRETVAVSPGDAEVARRIGLAIGIDPAPVVGSDVSTAPAAGAAYVVRSGDSIYGIARQVAGDDPAVVADYAERILDANHGRDMGDGRRLVNAAFIDVGWVLHLPPLGATPADAEVPPPDERVHVVQQGESLWSIAEDELGEATRWPELFEQNVGRTFGDGRTLAEPDLIRPGWQLGLPAPPTSAVPADDPAADATGDTADDGTTDDSHGTTIGADDSSSPEPVGNDPSTTWLPPSPDEVSDALERPVEDPRPDVVWVDEGGPPAPRSLNAPTGLDAGGATGSDESDPPISAPAQHLGLVTLRAAAMLSCGVLALLAVRRRAQLRQARPRAELMPPSVADAATERVLRASDVGERLARVDVAIRAAARQLVEQGRRVQFAMCSHDGEVELLVDGSVVLPPPWHGEHEHWVLPGSTPIEVLAPLARSVGAPCPTLVQLGIDELGRDVYVDLEGVEAIEIGGPADDADAIVTALAATLAASALAEGTALVAAGVPDDAFLGHRFHRRAGDPASAFVVARNELGATATVTTSTFELRSRVTAGEQWEPAVVLCGSGVEVVRPPRDRTGLAVVSAAPIEGPSSRLAPEAGMWLLKPAGIRLRPVGLHPDELHALAHLMHGATVIPMIPDEVDMQLGDDHRALTGDDTVYDVHDDPLEAAAALAALAGEPSADLASKPPHERPQPDDWTLLVRLLGAVEVVDREGVAADLGRTKTKELVAWLATHRDRSTRGNARTALWEHEVRDATFANTVSEARRSLARLVAPPPGEEWVGRTMSDALPLHPAVRTDAELLEAALAAARVQPPDQAIVTLTPAVERIAGMPFEGTSYVWPDAEGLTSSLILLATSAAAELAAHCLSVGDVEGVFRATGRGLRVLAGHEELIGLRMRAHARVGDLAGVRSEWETYERMVNGDLWSDGEPSPKLFDLRTKLLHPSR